MILAQVGEWFKSETARHVAVVFITVLIFAFGLGLGRLSRQEAGESPLTITAPNLTADTQGATLGGAQGRTLEPLKPLTAGDSKFVASKNGKRYYLPWCSGVERIKPENLIGFASREEAEARGLTPAANCPGLE